MTQRLNATRARGADKAHLEHVSVRVGSHEESCCCRLASTGLFFIVLADGCGLCAHEELRGHRAGPLLAHRGDQTPALPQAPVPC